MKIFRLCPLLGDVAKQARFQPLRELLEPAEDTPVDQLSNQLRAELLEGEAKPTKVLLASLFCRMRRPCQRSIFEACQRGLG